MSIDRSICEVIKKTDVCPDFILMDVPGWENTIKKNYVNLCKRCKNNRPNSPYGCKAINNNNYAAFAPLSKRVLKVITFIPKSKKNKTC